MDESCPDTAYGLLFAPYTATYIQQSVQHTRACLLSQAHVLSLAEAEGVEVAESYTINPSVDVLINRMEEILETKDISSS